MRISDLKKAFLIALVSVATLCCSKKAGTNDDTQRPVITLTSPLVNQSYSTGQTINIAGTIADNGTIAEVHIHVTNAVTGVKYLDVHLFPGSSTTPFFNQDLTATPGVTYKVEIIAIDRAVNEGRISIQVSCN